MVYYPPTDWELKDFYREHADTLYRSCCFLTCGQGDAQKMTEDIFLSLLNKGMIFSSDKDAIAWMILAAYKMSRKPPRPAEEQTIIREELSSEADDTGSGEKEDEQHLPETPVAELADASDQAAQICASEAQSSDAEEKNTAESCDEKASAVQPQFPEELRKLSRKDKLIALMYYCEGYRKAEIANYLGWPTFRVSNRLMRIKKRILPEKGTVEAC